jgi:4-amino-4-deoxy-L-arabinose transferase-like glycosyltransferase
MSTRPDVILRPIPLSARQWLVLLIGVALLWWLALAEITPGPVVKDAGENLQMALNLAHHGVISLDEAPPYRPSMMREPVPIAVLAQAVHLTDAALGIAEPQSYFSGTRARDLKFVNLFWLTLLAISTTLAVRHFTSSFVLAVIGGGLVALHFTRFVPIALRQYLGVDNLDTELAGAAVLSIACLLLALGIARGKRLILAGAGICFGLAALTKAALFYVCLGAVCLVAACHAIGWLRGRWSQPGTLSLYGALITGFLLVTLSWLYRNDHQIGYLQIAERSGSVLMHRAFLDEMTPREYGGAFAVWGEPHVCQIVSRLSGFGVADLDAGGRLLRLSEKLSGAAQDREVAAEESGRPDQAVTWYRKARATYEANLARFTRAGAPYPSGAADVETRDEAIRMIVTRPLKHAALMPLLLWRGVPLTFPVLIIGAVYAWRRQRLDALLFLVPAIALALFYAAASQFAPRFGYVIYPSALVALAIIVSALVRPLLASGRKHSLGRTRAD